LPPTPSSPSAEPPPRRLAIGALAAVIVVVVGALLFVSIRSHQRSVGAAKVSGTFLLHKAAPDFRATDLEGHTVSLSQYRGRPLIVSFAASWCHPCNQEYPLLVKAAKKYKGKLAVISVMHDDLTVDERRFLAGFKVPWPAVDDQSNAISTAFRVAEIPDTFFITADGVVQTREFGITTKAALDRPLKALLATS
jgi:cytochrome c biogenesis protein CcmG, thiol:disulfide interchange protein DsbE